MDRMFANGPEKWDLIPGQVRQKKKKKKKKKKKVLDTSLLKAQNYDVHIKGQVGQSREKSSVFPYTSV